jgi:phospholipid/cholesterol/gamma-HCH transport system substrate-binding protein
MVSQRTLESFVGLFILATIAGLLVLAFKVSGLTSFFKPPGYDVTAQFDDIGSLKVRAPVKISGVLIGEVTSIMLDPATFRAVVKFHVDSNFSHIPDDSSVSILTAGLLGDNYLAISPMYSQSFLKDGSVISDTHSAMILEKLIGQMIYKLSNPATPAAGSDSKAGIVPPPPSTNPPEDANPMPAKPVTPDKADPEADPKDLNPSIPVIIPKKPATNTNKGKTSPVEINYERFV